MGIAPGYSGGQRLAYAPQGLDELPQELTINGTTVHPTFLYRGEDATASAFPATIGTDMSLVEGGTNITPSQDAAMIEGAGQSVLFGGGDYFYINDSAVYNVTTEDYIIEIVMQANITTHDKFPYDKLQTIGTRVGTKFNWVVGSLIATTSWNGVDYNCQGYGGGSLADDDWVHALFVVDRSGSQILYVNKVASLPIDVSTAVGQDLTSNVTPKMGQAYPRGIAWMAMWMQDNWLDSHLQPALAVSRNAIIFGG